MEKDRDEKLWLLAKKRAGFQRSLASYFIVIAFLWAVWWFSTDREHMESGIPWPAWVMIGWGIGLLFQYMNAYGGSKKDLVEKEYEKLKKKDFES